MAARPPALIIADDLDILPAIREACESTQTPLFVSPKPCSAVIDLLRIYLSRRLAGSTSVHGVLMDVFGMGVLITGDSGVGKSELALELISRGHGLVADDVVELACIAPTTIEGRCPSMLRDYLEVRGLGLAQHPHHFRRDRIAPENEAQLIAHLQRPLSSSDGPRLPLDAQSQDILGVSIRKVVIPVAAGRNIAVLLEAAVRNSILQLRGIDSMGDLSIASSRRCLTTTFSSGLITAFPQPRRIPMKALIAIVALVFASGGAFAAEEKKEPSAAQKAQQEKMTFCNAEAKKRL
jgi:HPr kinase/phosphorylase